MSPDTSESASDAVTVFRSNPPHPEATRALKSSTAHEVCKVVDQSVHKSAQLVTRGAHKTAKRTKAGIKHGVSAGRALCLRHPRAFSILLGVLLPLWLIIFMSLGFGYFLSLIEAPNEVRANDSYLAARDEVRMITWLASNYTRSLPKLCFEEYLRIKANLTLDTDANIEADISDAFEAQNSNLFHEPRQTSLNDTETIMISPELKSFMIRCGRISSPKIEELIQRALRISRELDGKLTFNWMRCYEGASGVSSRTIKVGKQRRVAHRIEEVRYEAQHDFYEEQWERDRREKLDALVETYTTQGNLTLEEARSKALWETATMATGGDACGFNSAASAFFFFTIMTTVGYGNQTPSTGLGRSLIISFGFVGILMFGLILARAGRVVSAIFDDFLGRVHPAFITRPWVSFLFWTGVYWGWMVVQAELYMRWKEGRLGQPFDFDDAFWFAFLTSTTVGLGDYYMEPEVLIVSDLLWAPAVILVGFLFFSAFLTKMIDVIYMIRPPGEEDLINEMLDQLISVQNPKGEPTFTQSDSSTDSPKNDDDSDHPSGSSQDVERIDEEAIPNDTDAA